MVLFVGQIETRMREREAFQEVDYRAAFGPLAKWATEIESADRVAEIVARAFAIARSGRPGPVVVALPEDVLSATTAVAAGPAVVVPVASPAPADVDRAMALLAAAERPLVVVGDVGWSAAARAGLRAFAEANRIPVVCDFRCQDVLDNASPAYAGDAGLGKAPHVRALLEEADLILAVGTMFSEILTEAYTLFGLPKMRARLIHAYPAEAELNRVYTADLPILAHPDALMPLLAARPPRPGAAAGEARVAAAHAAWEASLATPPQPGGLDMGAVVRHLQAVLPADAILTNGAGNFSIWSNKHLRFTGGMRLLGPQSGAMGYGLPAAIAAKIARPDACVVCLAGDGDFQMTMQELGCALQAGVAPIVLVVNNGSYGTIRMHQERTYPGRVGFTDIVNPDFVAVAAAYGLHAERVERTAGFAAAFERARASRTGAVLELMVDTESLTPKRTLSALRAEGEARAMAGA